MPVSPRRARHASLAVIACLLLFHGAAARAQQPYVDTTPRRACDVPRTIARVTPGDSIPVCLARVHVLASATLKDVLGAQDAKAVATGALGLQYEGNVYLASGFINVAGTNDTVRTGYGSSLLTPSAGQGLNAAQLIIQRRVHAWNDTTCASLASTIWCNVSLRLAMDASTRRWATLVQREAPVAGGTDSVERVVSVMDVPNWGLDAGVAYSFFSGTVAGSDTVARPVGMVADFGFAMRALRGDMTSDSREALRERLLGGSGSTWYGWELGLDLVYDQIRTRFRYIHLLGGVDGLTGGQIVAGVELRAALVSGLLRRN